MRLIALGEYEYNTMELALPIYDNQRRMLLASGRQIHPRYREKLEDLGIRYVFVDDALSKDISMEHVVDMPTWMDMIETVGACHAAAKSRKPLPLLELLRGIGKLLSEVRGRPLLTTIPSAAMAADLKPHAHAVNVTILSLQIAKAMSYNELQLRDLAVGCLLHDIGKALTDDEKLHPEAGFNLLRRIHEIHLMSAHIAYQHHETMDGQGYPRGLSGDKIPVNAQICGLSNYYDNLIAKDMVPYHDALEMVMGQSGVSYAPEVVQAFVRSVPPYPPGMKVQLSNGEYALVTRIKEHMHRPAVRILSSGEEIRLAEHPSIRIES